MNRITLPEERMVPSVATPPRELLGRDALAAGLRLALERARSREALVVALFALAFAAAAGLIERGVASLGAPDRAVIPAFRFVLPLAAVAWLRTLTGGRRLGDAAWALSRFGLETRLVALGSLMGAGLVSSLLGGLVALATLLTAGGSASDALTTTRLGAGFGLVYAAVGGLAATLPLRRAGLWLVVVDAFLWGASAAPLLALPGAHVRSLVGVGAAGGLSQVQSSLVLTLMTLVLTAAACVRTGPAQREG